MSDASYTNRTLFSRVMLAKALLEYPEPQESMLLMGRFATPWLQSVWKAYAEGFQFDPQPDLDALNTSSKFLDSRIASVIAMFPAPAQELEPHFALMTLSARPEDGPRRYFTLEKGSAGAATRLYEWIPDPSERYGYQGVHQGDGIEPTLDAFTTAVEVRVLSGPPPTLTKPAAPVGVPTFVRHVVIRGKSQVRVVVEPSELKASGLESCEAMIMGIRSDAASVTRANPFTGEVQTIEFGMPASIFERMPDLIFAREPNAEFTTVQKTRPGHLFTVNADKQPLMLNLVVPADADQHVFSSAIKLLVMISGEPDPAAGLAAQQKEATAADIWQSRPALVSLLVKWPDSDDKLADLLGFTMHFGAAILKENLPPVSAPPPRSDAPPAKSGSFFGRLGQWFSKN